MARRKLCPGSMALESKFPDPADENRFAEEGRLLHDLLRDPKKSRANLLPEQFETLEKCERMERDFIKVVLDRHPLPKQNLPR